MIYLMVFVVSGVVIFLAWCLFGLLLTPVFGSDMVTLCYVRGDGENMENRVRSYSWLREGKLCGGRLVLVDCGLTRQGLDAAMVLRRRYDWVGYCPLPALEDYLSMLQVGPVLEKRGDL